MKTLTRMRFVAATVMTLAAVSMLAGGARAYVQTNLVSDISGLATITDPELINPWGVSFSTTSPFWVSNQGTNTATLYTVTGSTNVAKVNINPPIGFVAIPTTMTGPQGPTGQVFNGGSSFPLNGTPARFIFANLNGTISAWNGGLAATLEPSTAISGAVYSGLAIGSVGTTPYLYAADDAAATAGIKVFDGSFANVTATTFAGKFVDPGLPAGLVPFNIQNIGGQLYVEYAPAGRPNQQHAALGQGVVDVYDTAGNFLRRVITGSQLAAPWGVALAPDHFGEFSDDLLVGNFSYDHSEINAFNPTNGAFLGSIPINDGGNGAGGLWALDFGIGGNNGSPFTLYFADGIGGEAHGLFGAVTVPEPTALSLLTAALGLFGIGRFGWRKTPRA